MPTERPAPTEFADLMEHSARAVAQARETVRQTRQIIRRCREARERYDATHARAPAAPRWPFERSFSAG